MKFAVQVNSSPYNGQGTRTAYQFALAAIDQGHQIFRVFFYFDGIYNAIGHAVVPDDESDFVTLWGNLARDHNVDLVVCVSAAQRRGLLEADIAIRQGLKTSLAAGFRISGLGQWVEAGIEADRLLVFGG